MSSMSQFSVCCISFLHGTFVLCAKVISRCSCKCLSIITSSDIEDQATEDDEMAEESYTEDYVTECISSTYHFFFEKCETLHAQTFKNDPNEVREEGVHGPMLESLHFWHELIALIISVIEEDKNKYNPVWNQFPEELNIAELDAVVMWTLFATDMKYNLKKHEQHQLCKSMDYLDLHFEVKCFYNKYIKDVPYFDSDVPEYAAWFEPFVMQWLKENGEKSLKYIHDVYTVDKIKYRFQKSSEHALFSKSVVDVFAYLTKCLELISKLDCNDLDIWKRYIKYFTNTISKVLIAYADIVKKEFSVHMEDERTACVLMNNIQQLLVQSKNIFNSMGCSMLEEDAAMIISDLKQKLIITLDELATIFVKRTCNQCILFVQAILQKFSFGEHVALEKYLCQYYISLESCISIKVREISVLFSNIKDDESIVVAKEVKKVIAQIMDHLCDFKSSCVDTCEKSVLIRIIKRLWKIVMRLLENTIVLPPMADRSMNLKSLTNNVKKNLVSNTGIEDLFRVFKNHIVGKQNVTSAISGVMEMERNLSPEQCAILGDSLDTLKNFFHDPRSGLTMDYLENTPEFQSLRFALFLYMQTTDALIKTFITARYSDGYKHNPNDPHSIWVFLDADTLRTGEESFGEVSLEVDLFTHKETGEYKVTVKVVEAKDLKWTMESGTFRPFVEVNLIGPYLSRKKHKHSTKSVPNNWSPKYNETFNFTIGNEDLLDYFQLQVCVKDYCFVQEDRLVGVTVLNFRDIVEQGSYAGWLILGKRIQMNDTRRKILHILSQSINDEVAQEFVKLKSDVRSENPSQNAQ